MSDMYDNITKTEAKTIVDSCKWILKNDVEKRNDDGEAKLITAMYSGKQSFGCTDYKDHRNNTLEELKKLVYNNLVDSRHQKLHYFKDRQNKIPYNTIVVEGYHGGYTAYFMA